MVGVRVRVCQIHPWTVVLDGGTGVEWGNLLGLGLVLVGKPIRVRVSVSGETY